MLHSTQILLTEILMLHSTQICINGDDYHVMLDNLLQNQAV